MDMINIVKILLITKLILHLLLLKNTKLSVSKTSTIKNRIEIMIKIHEEYKNR